MIHFGVTEKKQSDLMQRMEQCGLLEKNIEEAFVRSGGAGGQRVNKTSTCVLLKHIPTGLSVKMQKSRTQMLNRYYARKQMCQLLENEQLGSQSPQARKIAKTRKQKDRARRRRKKVLRNQDRDKE